ncbi:Hypothetical protein FKW44_009792, partial [Caligus rogercresseyi]
MDNGNSYINKSPFTGPFGVNTLKLKTFTSTTKTNFSTELIFMQEEFKHPRRRKEDCILLQTLFCGKESLRSSMSDVELQ